MLNNLNDLQCRISSAEGLPAKDVIIIGVVVLVIGAGLLIFSKIKK